MCPMNFSPVFLISYHAVLWEFYYCETLVHQFCSYETILKPSIIMLWSCGCTGWKSFLNIGEMMLNHLLTNFSVFLLKWRIYIRSFFVDLLFSYIYLSWHIFPKILLPIWSSYGVSSRGLKCLSQKSADPIKFL